MNGNLVGSIGKVQMRSLKSLKFVFGCQLSSLMSDLQVQRKSFLRLMACLGLGMTYEVVYLTKTSFYNKIKKLIQINTMNLLE